MDSTLLVDLLAGVNGGFASVFVGQPLDTVKVKMQLFPKMYGGMISCLSNTVRQQGFRGLYAGVLPALVSNGADNAVMFGTYGQCQKIVARVRGAGDTIDLNYIENAAAGSFASFFSASVLCPTELVKIRMQGISNDAQLEGQSADQVFKNIWKSEGFKGLYRGLGCTIVREFIGCSVFFGVYERARELLKPLGKRKEDCDAVATMVAGSLAGICTSLVIYPIDVIKSRVQMAVKKSEFQMVRNEILSNGSRGLYSGLLPTIVKTVPVTGVLLLTVELSKPFYRKYLSEISFPSNVPYEKFFSVCDFISGWTAGIVSTLIGHPIDTVKVVQQVTNSSIEKTVKDIYKQDKFKGYFRGMMFPILNVGVANSVFFGTYGNVMRFIQVQRDDQTNKNIDVRFCSDAEYLHKYWHFDVFLSGCIAGFSYALINTPIEVIKTLLQARNITLKQENVAEKKEKKADPLKTSSAFKLMVELYKINGIRSLYRGGTLLFIRDVPSMGIYMLSYEHLCSMLMKLSYSETNTESMPKHVHIVSGGVAGVLSWVLVLPFDVIKSKIITDSVMQPLYKGAWDCAKKTYNNDGAISFLRGFWLLCIRAFPVNGIAFATYETIVNSCSEKKMNRLKKTTVESKWM